MCGTGTRSIILHQIISANSSVHTHDVRLRNCRHDFLYEDDKVKCFLCIAQHSYVYKFHSTIAFKQNVKFL